ncbi:hypothetical protein Tco_0088763 [Tanacetum coccineum]
MVSLEKNQVCSLVRISAEKKASQRLWMFKVKEEQNGRKRYKARLVVKDFQQKRGEPSYVGALNESSTQHKSEGFQLAGQEENLECRLKEILYGLIQAPRLRYLKFDNFMQKDKALTWQSLTSLSDSWNEEPCSDVHQVGDEIKVKVLRSFNWPPTELIKEIVSYQERLIVVQPQVNPDSIDSSGSQITPFRVGQVAQPQVNPDSTIAQVEQLMPFRVGQAVQRL